MLAGNKVDMERSRQVSVEESEAYAASIGAPLFGTSAKLNRGVEQAFLAIARSACPRAVAPPSARLVDWSCVRAELVEQHKAAPLAAGAGPGAAAYRPRAGIVVLQQGEGEARQKPLAAGACC